MSGMASSQRSLLLDVSRLVWRRWVGGLPTGIDRPCLAYLQHFGSKSQLVVQRKGFRRILSPSQSDDLAGVLLEGGASFRRQLMALGMRCFLRPSVDQRGQKRLYLNVGHTGLNADDLPEWVKQADVRAIFMIYDLIPLTHPEYSRPGEPAKHHKRLQNAITSGSGIISISEHTSDELRGYSAEHGMRMPALVTVPLAIDEGHHLPQKTPVTDRPYFVTIGTIEGRKNHVLLLQLWKRLAADLGERTPKLVIIGQRGWEAQTAFAMLDRCDDLRPHIVELNRCSDEDKIKYLTGARAMLMPSFSEGYGIPVAEALQLGVPVIASTLSVYREIASNIPLLIDPYDLPAWERAVRDYINDIGDRSRQLIAIPQFVPTTWPMHFEKVEEWLKFIS